MDLETIVFQRYTGEARLQRLLYIAYHAAAQDDADPAVNTTYNHDRRDMNENPTMMMSREGGAASSSSSNPEDTSGVAAAALSSSLSGGTILNGSIGSAAAAVAASHSSLHRRRVLAQAALDAAVDHCLLSGNTTRYKDIYERAAAAMASSMEITITTATTTTAATSSWYARPSKPFHPAWVQSTEQQQQQQRDILQHRLATAQAHLNKEAIRTAYLAIAHHEGAICGHVLDALHACLRAKDYCTSRSQTAALSWQIVQWAMHVPNYVTVREFVSKTQHAVGGNETLGGGGGGGGASSASSSSVTSHSSTMDLLRYHAGVASALERLSQGDYSRAAATLRAVVCAGFPSQLQLVTAALMSGSEGIGEISNTSSGADPTSMAMDASTAAALSTTAAGATTPSGWLLSPEDVTQLAVVLSLPEDRATWMPQLAATGVSATTTTNAGSTGGGANSSSTMVAQPGGGSSSSSSAEAALELVPAVAQVVQAFGPRAQYAAAWNILEQSVWQTMPLDIYMAPHLKIIQQAIRERAIMQFWQAHQRVPLAVMAQELGPGIVQMPSSSQKPHFPVASSSPAFTMMHMVLDLLQRGKLPDDTRLDMQAMTLVRDGDLTQPQHLADEQRLQQTACRLQAVQQAFLRDATSMVVRFACWQMRGGDSGTGGSDRHSRAAAAAAYRRGGGRPPPGSGGAFHLGGFSDLDDDEDDRYGGGGRGLDDDDDDDPYGGGDAAAMLMRAAAEGGMMMMGGGGGGPYDGDEDGGVVGDDDGMVMQHEGDDEEDAAMMDVGQMNPEDLY